MNWRGIKRRKLGFQISQSITDMGEFNAGRELAKLRKSRELNCLVCQKPFSSVAQAKYCCNQCKQSAAYARRPKPPVNVNCKRCGVEICTEDKRIKYCSDECRVLFRIFK